VIAPYLALGLPDIKAIGNAPTWTTLSRGRFKVSCDNYDIQISEPEVILDYYKNAKDEVADDDSDIKVRRDITSNERDCLLSAVSRIKALKSN
jgi:hypothetical protein